VTGSAPPHFVLYSRSYCHLCEDMLAALDVCLAGAGLAYTVDVLDVDADSALVARYDELVPVLATGAGNVKLCHYFLDAPAVLRHAHGEGAEAKVQKRA
jgi:hypothetical protein